MVQPFYPEFDLSWAERRCYFRHLAIFSRRRQLRSTL